MASRRIFRLPYGSSSGWPTNPRNRRKDMSIIRTGRATWFLSILVLATPMVLPLAGSDRSKPPKANEQREPSEITSIVYRIIANEWKCYQKLQEYSPRVETY